MTDIMELEADLAYPLETGGVLVGYRLDTGETVITDCIGPGPEAIHQRDRFHPDHTWQCQQLESLYESTGRVFVYLGDWHTHPDGTAIMSLLDHQTLIAIAKHPEARNQHPLMMLGAGSPGQWQWRSYGYQGRKWFGLSAKCSEYALQVYWEYPIDRRS